MLGVGLLLICLVIMIGEGAPNPLTQPPRVLMGFVALALLALGILLGWISEAWGGALSIFAWTMFVLITRVSLSGPRLFVVLLAVPGILYLASAAFRRTRFRSETG
ncbi:hypothetical protein DB347_02240 [Opitutaceae bacterium EW11]|nr:hypothetical protein DB347_02240 [Opitutaceae bacterium EW11]